MTTQLLELPLWLEELTDRLLTGLPVEAVAGVIPPNREMFRADLLEYIPRCNNFTLVRWDFCLYVIDQLDNLSRKINYAAEKDPEVKGWAVDRLRNPTPKSVRYRLSPIELVNEAFNSYELLNEHRCFWSKHDIWVFDSDEAYKEYAYVLTKHLKLNASQK